MESERTRIQAEIAVHTKAIALLSGQLNTLTFVARLPPEVLAYMFLWYAAFMEVAYHLNRGSYQDWVGITHVCRHWREVALSTPELWSDLVIREDGGSVGRVQTFLQRSKQAPLKIEAVRLSKKWQPVFVAIAREGERAQEITLILKAPFLNTIAENFPTRAPLLRKLWIIGQEMQDRPTSVGTNHQDRPLPSAFMQCDMPALKDLSIRGTRLLWTKGLFPTSLTRLSVQSTFSTNDFFTYADVAEAINDLQNLEYLELGDIFPSHFPYQTTRPSSRRSLRLPRLKEFQLSGAILPTTYFLDYCELPADVHIGFHFGYTQNNPQDFYDMAPPLAAKLNEGRNNGEDRPVKAAFVRENHVELLRDPMPWVDRMYDPFEKFSGLGMWTHSRVIQEGVFFARLGSRLPLHNILELTLINIPFNMNRRTAWGEMLRCMPNLECLTVFGQPRSAGPADHRYALLDLLDTRISRSDDSEEEKCVVPRLRELWLRDVKFRRPGDRQNTSLVTGLTRVLKSREREGCRVLQRICVDACFCVEESDLLALRSVVPEVEWDEWFRVDEYEDEREDDE